MMWNLLVVDDEPLNLEIIGEYLDDPEFNLVFAGNGQEAWEKLLTAERPIDLIVLDRMMPVMNGMELLKRVKADERFRHAPVIMQTAASSPEEVREGIEAGAHYYLTKPYDPSSLLAIVRAAIDELVERRGAETAVADLSGAVARITRGEFSVVSLDHAHQLARMLATLCPDPAPVAMGLTELLVNAVEHGNLGISYAEKKRLRQADAWESEVARRLGLPEYRERVARIQVERAPGEWVFLIEDAGAGFDWRRYLQFDPERAFDPNGRGIAMAGLVAFSQIEYLGCGNQVRARVPLGDGARE